MADDRALPAAAKALLEWYDAVRRDLPWRRRRDPYAIWVSEIMLQQTQVETVLGYYEGFLARFPDVEALAAASEEEVLSAWSGLGYYRRARFLHAAARRIAESGHWPTSAAEWRALPGVGEYTAAAISSIAGGEPVVVLDGNVERVISRLLASTEDPKKAAVRRELRRAAERLLDVGRAGDSNQALMELGATVCRPLAPNCGACPLTVWCAGYRAGDPERYPPPRRRRAQQRVRRRVFVVEAEGRILLFRRATDADRLAGFWELPWVDGRGGAAALGRKYGGRWRIGRLRGTARHAITHRRFEVSVHDASWAPDAAAESSPAGWYAKAEIEELPTSSLVDKSLRAAAGRAPARGRSA